jgi:hypothetical protein
MGPHGRPYVVDHHHWARAWLELGHLEAPGTVVADLRHLDIGAFWEQMQALGHVHPYDEHGQRLDIQALPSTVLEMRDDPYRSLAAFARNAGAYRKPGNAYGDFQWAGLLRDNIDGRLDTIGGFALALARAVRLARSRKAKALPGYIGREAPIPDA